MNLEIKDHKNWKLWGHTPIYDVLWDYYKEIYSSFLDTGVAFRLMANDGDNDLNKFDFDYISHVAENIDFFMENAFVALKNEIKKRSDIIGKDLFYNFLKFSKEEILDSIVFKHGKKMSLIIKCKIAKTLKFVNDEGRFVRIKIYYEEDNLKSVRIFY